MERREESKPWYREFWPWFLMLFPAAAVVGGLITAHIAAQSDDGVVDDDYYKQGLAINRVLARSEAAAAKGLAGTLAVDGGRLSLQLSGRLDPWPPRLVLRILHPTRAGMDQSVTLGGRGGGRYDGLCEPLGAGKWKLVLEDEARTWRLSGQLEPGHREAVLAPAR